MVKNKLVSVNILAFNAQDLIEPCLKAVAQQTYNNIEVLVIDNASQDNTLGQVTRYKKQDTNKDFRYHWFADV